MKALVGRTARAGIAVASALAFTQAWAQPNPPSAPASPPTPEQRAQGTAPQQMPGTPATPEQRAQGMAPQQMPGGQPATPTPQARAIAPVFSGIGTWTGEVPAGAMGQGSPQMSSQGRAACKQVLNGNWYACDVEIRTGTGTRVSDWKGHFVVGWDANVNGYRAALVDNQNASMTEMNGSVTGKTLALETPTEELVNGEKMKQRLTFDYTDPNNIKYTDERQRPGQAWQVFERATIRVEGAMRQARTPAKK